MVNLKKSHIHLLIANKLLSFVILLMYFIIINLKFTFYILHKTVIYLKFTKSSQR